MTKESSQELILNPYVETLRSDITRLNAEIIEWRNSEAGLIKENNEMRELIGKLKDRNHKLKSYLSSFRDLLIDYYNDAIE